MVDRYLDELRGSLSRHRDVDDLVDEVADHLLSGVQRWAHQGFGPGEAERRTLDAFGEPRLVARVYASQRSGGFTMPTQFTKNAGTSLYLAGVLWLVGIVLLEGSVITDQSRPWEGLPQVLYMLGSTGLLVGGIAAFVGGLGLFRRHAGEGLAPIAALIALGVGAVATFVTWFVLGWALFLALGAGGLAVWMSRYGVAPTSATWAWGGGAVAALLVVIGVEATVQFGDDGTTHVVTWSLLMATQVVYAAGMLGLGRWLRSEQPVDDPENALVA